MVMGHQTASIHVPTIRQICVPGLRLRRPRLRRLHRLHRRLHRRRPLNWQIRCTPIPYSSLQLFECSDAPVVLIMCTYRTYVGSVIFACLAKGRRRVERCLLAANGGMILFHNLLHRINCSISEGRHDGMCRLIGSITIKVSSMWTILTFDTTSRVGPRDMSFDEKKAMR